MLPSDIETVASRFLDLALPRAPAASANLTALGQPSHHATTAPPAGAACTRLTCRLPNPTRSVAFHFPPAPDAFIDRLLECLASSARRILGGSNESASETLFELA